MGSPESKTTAPATCSHLPQTDPLAGLPADRTDGADSSQSAEAAPGQKQAAVSTSPVERCEACVWEKKAARVYRAKIIAGLILPFTLGAFDATV